MRTAALLLLALALCVSVARAAYLYSDASLQLGTDFGIIKWDPNQQQAAPITVVSLDVVDVGDGFYNGGCANPAAGVAYMILGNGTQHTPYEIITVTLATGKWTGPAKFSLATPAIPQWWVWSPVLGKIITASYAKDTLAIIGVDPVSLQTTNIAALNLKLEYYPGNVAIDPVGNVLYFTMQAHSTTTLYSVNCTSGKYAAHTFPSGHNIEEVTWDVANERLVALNVTYSWLGPIPTDPMDHVITIDPTTFATQQFGLPNQQLSHLLAGVAATNGTMYWHAVMQAGPGSFDHVVAWNLQTNTFAVQNLLQFVQPQSWLMYVD